MLKRKSTENPPLIDTSNHDLLNTTATSTPTITTTSTATPPTTTTTDAPTTTHTQDHKRSKRMFNHLLGTLNKIKEQDSTPSEALLKRQMIEKKLYDKLAKEKEELSTKLSSQLQMKRSALELNRAQLDSSRIQNLNLTIKTNILLKKDFIQTTTTPPIFFLPKIHNEKTTQLLKDSNLKYQQEFDSFDFFNLPTPITSPTAMDLETPSSDVKSIKGSASKSSSDSIITEVSPDSTPIAQNNSTVPETNENESAMELESKESNEHKEPKLL